MRNNQGGALADTVAPAEEVILVKTVAFPGFGGQFGTSADSLLTVFIGGPYLGMTMNIELDAKGEKFNQFQFKKVFAEDSLRTVFSLEPKQEGKMTFYRFYVSNKTDNIFINAYVIQSSFEKYKPEIERVVKTVRIEKPEKK